MCRLWKNALSRTLNLPWRKFTRRISPVVMLAILPTLVSSNLALAKPNEQIQFKRTQRSQLTAYSYQWRDHNNTRRFISFDIAHQDKQALSYSQPNYMPHLAMQQVLSDLTKLAQRLDPKRVRVSLELNNHTIDIAMRGDDTELMERLRTEFVSEQDKAFKRYLELHYFEQFTDSMGENAIKVDHLRYIKEFKKVMMPVAQAFFDNMSGGSPRDFFNIMLSWVQSIPYNTLDSRSDTNATGFLPPTALLDGNIGDCDSKSVLMASILRTLLPNADLRLVILPKHALLAIGISYTADDVTIIENGVHLVLAEATGPGAFAVGEIAKSSQYDIDRGLYITQKIPR